MFLMFQNYETINGIIFWFFPELENFHIDQEKVIEFIIFISSGGQVEKFVIEIRSRALLQTFLEYIT